MKFRPLIHVSFGFLSLALAVQANGQESIVLDDNIEVQDIGATEVQAASTEKEDQPIASIPRFDPNPTTSSSEASKSNRPSAADLRQARALYRSQQRIRRLEYNTWMGHEPLRPKWNAMPMMSSRYSNPRVYVPIFVYRR